MSLVSCVVVFVGSGFRENFGFFQRSNIERTLLKCALFVDMDNSHFDIYASGKFKSEFIKIVAQCFLCNSNL